MRHHECKGSPDCVFCNPLRQRQTAHPLPSALAGVTPEMARELGEAADHIDRAAAILRALADSIEQTEGKPVEDDPEDRRRIITLPGGAEIVLHTCFQIDPKPGSCDCRERGIASDIAAGLRESEAKP